MSGKPWVPPDRGPLPQAAHNKLQTLLRLC